MTDRHARRRGSPPIGRFRRLMLVCALSSAAVVLACPTLAMAEGPNAIMKPAGYDVNLITRGDDNAFQVVALPFTMRWGTNTYTQIYINQNGNCTFGSSFTPQYTPTTPLNNVRRDIMAPFWADVDTRVGGQSTYSNTAAPPHVDGHNAFFVNWINAGYYNQHADKLNSFQLVLVDRSDTGAGNFDFIFNYDKVQWDTGDVSGSQRARAGWGKSNRTGYELPGSGSTAGGIGPLLDTGASATSLIQNYQNTEGQLGRYEWEVRAGAAPNVPPIIDSVDTTLEGNAAGGYSGYTGAGDATAEDPDGTIASFTRSPVAGTFLLLGTNTVVWTATDNRGAVTTEAQTVVVADTTPPKNPTISSSSHTAGVWSKVPTATFSWASATDACSGLDGYSYSWSQNSTSLPDLARDTTGSAVTTRLGDGVWYFNIRTGDRAGNWSTVATSFGQVRIDTTLPGTSDNAPSTWQSANVNVTLTAADSGSGVAYTRYKLNAGAVATYTGTPVAVTVEGTNTLLYWSVDNVGNSETTHSVNVLIDKTAPAGTFALLGGAAYTGTATVSFDSSMTSDAFEMRFDTGSGYGAWMPYAVTTSGVLPSGDGTKTVNAQYRDRAGNLTTRSDSIVMLIGLPTTALTVSPGAPNGANGWYVGAQPTVALSSNKPGTTYFSWTAGGPFGAYAATLTVPVGLSTLYYCSVDLAGNREATRSAAFKVDVGVPTVPGSVVATAADISSIEVSWTASTDVGSGVAFYRVMRNGSLVGTTSAVAYTDTGLSAGQSYTYTIVGVDAAGNPSAQSAPATVVLPAQMLWMQVSNGSVSFNGIDPGTQTTNTTATVVTVGGLGAFGYDLTCDAPDFVNADALSDSPTMPIGVMAFLTRGFASVPLQAFASSSRLIDSSTGVPRTWHHDYVFDYAITVPWTSSPGTYTTTVTYTALAK